jgi:hypothetical protein
MAYREVGWEGCREDFSGFLILCCHTHKSFFSRNIQQPSSWRFPFSPGFYAFTWMCHVLPSPSAWITRKKNTSPGHDRVFPTPSEGPVMFSLLATSTCSNIPKESINNSERFRMFALELYLHNFTNSPMSNRRMGQRVLDVHSYGSVKFQYKSHR